MPDDRHGCLQDVHWSAGLFAYFPTYTLGNIFSAQLFKAAERDLGDMKTLFAKGEYLPLLQWLRTHIHRHGKRYLGADLVQRACGEPVSIEPLVGYLRHKYSAVYDL